MPFENTESKKTIAEYDCLRVIATLLVVLGHCAFIVISSDFGGIDYSALITGKSFIMKLSEKINSFIYIFHMPLFMALSGALFQLSMSRKKYNKLSGLVIDKAKRLLIPFIVVSICYSFPLKLMSGYYSESGNIFTDLIFGQLLLQGNSHLWYCLTLFIIFILAYVLEKICGKLNKNNKYMFIFKLCILIASYLLSSKISIHIISYVCEYALWFYMGFYFELVREKFNNYLRKPIFVFACFFSAICLYALNYLLNDKTHFIIRVVNRLIMILLIISLCLCFYIISYAFSRTSIIKTKCFKLLLRDSFGIYLYSDSLNYVILYACTSLFGDSVFVSNIGSLTLYFTRFFVTLIISVVITELLRKLNVKYLY